jgi:glycine cleavage system H lipoate-binding protein
MQGDIFATKGPEYLIVIAYLVLLVLAARYLAPAPVPQTAGARRARRGLSVPWFSLKEGFRFHQGHTWAAEADGEVVTVGVDDFAAQLVGAPDALELPGVGTDVRQGAQGWRLRAGDRTLAMLSPVNGRVVAVNQAVLDTPQLATDDPYGAGWLLKVRAPDQKLSLRNLLSGELAAAWMRQTVERLRALPAGGLGTVMPDGGVPVRGFGRALSQEEWDVVTREFFLSE